MNGKKHIFYSNKIDQVEGNIKKLLNSQEDFLSAATVNSPRAVGDAIQEILGNHLQAVLGEEICKNYSAHFAHRAMADLFL
ncbi:hypothetical protein [Thermosynechococcus sp.]|uniref:hypothetical protein n=1 Tax=Thermosynechococcus sp. TaxID=2814275 RepID=UPI003918C4B8